MIYISDSVLTKNFWREFKSETGNDPEETVRSRAGKTSHQEIFASHGITASITKGEVNFIEIYPPSSVQDYLKNIYEEPGIFIR